VPKIRKSPILNFLSTRRQRKKAPTVTTQDAEFDHRSPIYPNLEFQKRRTQNKRFPKYTNGGGGFEDPQLQEYVLEGLKPKTLLKSDPLKLKPSRELLN